MSLADEVALRYPTQILKELSNPRGTAQTSVNTTKLEQACTSIQRQFRLYVQKAYDSTLVEHIDIAVDGVVALLQRWGGTSKSVARVRWDDWIEQCRALRDVGPRARIPVTSSGALSMTAEASGETSPFDSKKLADVTPTANSGLDDLE